MSINWDEFDNEIDGIIEESSNSTDDELASRISSLTKMTDEEVKGLFPNPSDVKKLAELMKIVKSSEEQNIKVKKIMDNTEQFSGIVLKLLDKLV